MPKIRRWFHVSHDINADHEVWLLTDTFGDRAFRLWLEILSIADRNDGLIPGWVADESPQFRRSLAGKCRLSGQRVHTILRFFDEQLWTEPGNPHRVRNHLKYRVSKEDKKSPDGIPSGASPTPTPTPTPPTPLLESNTYEVLLSSPRQEKLVAPIPAVWPDDGLWLKEFIERQTVAPSKHLLDQVWWKDVATSSGGIDLEFLETEFARMSAWLNENASRAPASRAGWKKFIRHWLERAHEKERKNNHVQLQKPKQYGYARH